MISRFSKTIPKHNILLSKYSINPTSRLFSSQNNPE
jgi:4-hydroxybenzoate polyprenyltransferase